MENREKSKTRDVIILCKGADRVLSDISKAFKYLHKKYNAECGSGFYSCSQEKW